MARKVLVSLVSDQTVPNLQLIKEIQADYYFFISTRRMENEGRSSWICNAANIPLEKVAKILVDENSPFDILTRILDFFTTHFDKNNDTFIVNITGGTKLMSIAVFNFFREYNSTIFYVNSPEKYTQLYRKLESHIINSEHQFEFKESVKLKEFLTCYGFEILGSGKNKTLSDESSTTKYNLEKMFSCFQDESFLSKNNKEIEIIRQNRGKRIDIENLKAYLEEIEFTPAKNGSLSREETKFLSGDWLEEYVFIKLKEELNLSDEYIGLGLNLRKNIQGKSEENEFDVLFMYKNKLHAIECKTSIFASSEDDKPRSLMGEILYKSDSLKNKFGLYPQTIIFTLSNIHQEDGKPLQSMAKHLERAELNKIKVISKKDLQKETKIAKLIGLI